MEHLIKIKYAILFSKMDLDWSGYLVLKRLEKNELDKLAGQNDWSDRCMRCRKFLHDGECEEYIIPKEINND